MALPRERHSRPLPASRTPSFRGLSGRVNLETCFQPLSGVGTIFPSDRPLLLVATASPQQIEFYRPRHFGSALVLCLTASMRQKDPKTQAGIISSTRKGGEVSRSRNRCYCENSMRLLISRGLGRRPHAPYPWEVRQHQHHHPRPNHRAWPTLSASTRTAFFRPRTSIENSVSTTTPNAAKTMHAAAAVVSATDFLLYLPGENSAVHRTQTSDPELPRELGGGFATD